MHGWNEKKRSDLRRKDERLCNELKLSVSKTASRPMASVSKVREISFFFPVSLKFTRDWYSGRGRMKFIDPEIGQQRP